MADYDVADLVARCKRHRRRPSTDEGTTDADWYAMLTEAEAHWKPVLAAHVPDAMFSAPVAMTTSDDGSTYDLPGSEDDPLALLVLRSEKGDLLKPGPYWDPNSDYVQEGGSIRMTRGRSVTFSDGPYARFIAGPGTIDAATDSTIQPARARILLVYHACELDASRGGMDDPSYYLALQQKTAFGDPAIPGDVGIIGALKAKNQTGGMAAFQGGGQYRWWRPNG